MNRRTALIALAGFLPAAACRPSEIRRVVEFGGETMGSTWLVRVVDASGALDEARRETVGGGMRDALRQIDALMSTWNPESELSRFNRSTSLEPFPLSPDTYEVFQWALRLSEETGGAFDVTVGPIVEAWGFGPAAGGQPDPPATATLALLRAAAGVRHLRLDVQTRSIRKLHPGVQCDFSALAPGYAADRAAELLEQHGLREFLADVGGEMVARGRNAAGRPWQIAVERPDGGTVPPRGASARAGTFARVVPLADEAIATSGDYRNFREIDGRRISHIIDPRTGRPVVHQLASATVVDQRAVRADALATALMVLGPDEGMALAERLGIGALLLVRSGGGFEERRSSRMRGLLEGRR